MMGTPPPHPFFPLRHSQHAETRTFALFGGWTMCASFFAAALNLSPRAHSFSATARYVVPLAIAAASLAAVRFETPIRRHVAAPGRQSSCLPVFQLSTVPIRGISEKYGGTANLAA